MSPQTRPRRFLPQPLEESVRTSRKKNVEHIEDPTGRQESTDASSSNSHYSYSDDTTLPGVPTSRPLTTSRRFTPEPVETSARSSRRKFVADPIETSTRKSKDKDNPEEASPKPRRKFAPEPVETSTRSSKNKKTDNAGDSPATTPRRKFALEPIETSTSSRRRRKADQDDIDQEPVKSDGSAASSRASSGPRKFAPELLETAKGSYRRIHSSTSGTRSPAPISSEPSLSPPLSPDEDDGADKVTELRESPFSAAALARKHPETLRQRSFVVPDLPMIESTTEEESSATPSLSDSPSSVETDNRKDPRSATQDSYTEYVLRLAAETVTEKELQEQAMAAYINERPHEPVDHFAISHDDEDDGPPQVPMFQGEKGVDARAFRRSSAAELDLELKHMQKHHEQLEQVKQGFKADTAGQSRFSAAALASRHALEAKGMKKTKKPRGIEEDSELARMRAAASPPMLGDDIIFPFTISPKMTRCDPDQAPRPRNADSDDEEKPSGSPTLWNTNGKPKLEGDGGLWMGLCQAGPWQPSGSSQSGLRSGIQTPSPQTPANERHNPFESSTPGRGSQTPGRRRPFSGLAFLPLTPPRSQDGEDIFTSTIDKKLHLEKQIEDEFPARVITQIYNYLSLGYPSLAHAFDEELSKISRISLEELRRDDYNVDAKGYVGAPEGDGCDESQVVGGKCKRWEALRSYVREWARQSPNFADDRRRLALGANEDWGARARKGSWGH